MLPVMPQCFAKNHVNMGRRNARNLHLFRGRKNLPQRIERDAEKLYGAQGRLWPTSGHGWQRRTSALASFPIRGFDLNPRGLILQNERTNKPMTQNQPYTWLDGEIIDSPKAQFPVLSHALHYGFGVFEGIRCYKQENGRSAIFRLDTHLRRLYESAKILKLTIPYPYEVVFAAAREIVRANKLVEAYIRPIAWLGEGSMGVGAFDNKVHVAISVWVWGAYLGEEGVRNGIRAKISSFNRAHPNNAMVRGKVTGQYVNSVLAKREAKDLGLDEAILLDHQGFVAEGSGENIFIIRNNKLITPSLAAPILRGVTRDSVIELAKENGIEVNEHSFHRDTLYVADEAFFTGTAAEITPIREVDHREIGSNKNWPITRTLQKAYKDAVTGRNPGRAAWLTYID